MENKEEIKPFRVSQKGDKIGRKRQAKEEKQG